VLFKEERIIHLGRNPINGGIPANEKRRIIRVIVMAGFILIMERLKDQCFDEVFHKIVIMEIVIRM